MQSQSLYSAPGAKRVQGLAQGPNDDSLAVLGNKKTVENKCHFQSLLVCDFFIILFAFSQFLL